MWGGDPPGPGRRLRRPPFDWISEAGPGGSGADEGVRPTFIGWSSKRIASGTGKNRIHVHPSRMRTGFRSRGCDQGRTALGHGRKQQAFGQESATRRKRPLPRGTRMTQRALGRRPGLQSSLNFQKPALFVHAVGDRVHQQHIADGVGERRIPRGGKRREESLVDPFMNARTV
jgi:hypothetical protein